MEMIYETDILVQAQQGSMHPGGLRLTDRAVRLAALGAGMRVADIGCGTGTTAAFLTEKYKLNMVGLDISDTLITIGLKLWPGLNLIRWNCDALPFEDDTLDAVFFECTLSLLGDTRRLLPQCATALKKKGTVIISDVYARHKTGSAFPLTADRLNENLRASGFDIIVQEDHTAALRTYIAELREKNGNSIDACSFFGTSCDSNNVRLSNLGYMLTIARKI